MGALRILVNDAMNNLHGWIEAGARQRGKNATGGTMRSLQIATAETPEFAEGTLSADSQWKYWGNGRGPGGLPPIRSIQQWIDNQGLDISPWAVARTMAAKGSKDFRQKNTNIILDAEEAWLRHDIPAVEEKSADLMEGAIIEVSKNTLGNA